MKIPNSTPALENSDLPTSLFSLFRLVSISSPLPVIVFKGVQQRPPPPLSITVIESFDVQQPLSHSLVPYMESVFLLSLCLSPANPLSRVLYRESVFLLSPLRWTTLVDSDIQISLSLSLS
eukprot:c45631_g1_i1 orf=2-361(-)